MPSPHTSTATHERCQVHPATPAIGQCDVCLRPVCLDCAIPIRGRVVGQECLATALGDPLVEAPQPRKRRFPDARRVLLSVGVPVAVVGTAVPWTRSSFGSGWFGAWGWSPLRWSVLAALGATLGALLLLAAMIRRVPSSLPWRIVLAGAAGATAAGSALHVWHPPPFTEPWLGPWVTLGGAVIWLAGSLLTPRPRFAGRGVPS